MAAMQDIDALRIVSFESGLVCGGACVRDVGAGYYSLCEWPCFFAWLSGLRLRFLRRFQDDGDPHNVITGHTGDHMGRPCEYAGFSTASEIRSLSEIRVPRRLPHHRPMIFHHKSPTEVQIARFTKEISSPTFHHRPVET